MGYDAVKERKAVEAKTQFHVDCAENTENVFKRAEMREVDEEFTMTCIDWIKRKKATQVTILQAREKHHAALKKIRGVPEEVVD